jgi:aldehyde:ferredoxin oxidoreductase
MDEADIATAMDLFYREMGWDTVTGAPTRAAYERAGLAHVARTLDEKGLLP